MKFANFFHYVVIEDELADLNDDSIINVLDIVQLVNIILNN